MAKPPPNPYDVGPPDPQPQPCRICYGDVDNPDEWFGCRCPECPACGVIGDPTCYSDTGHMLPSAKVEPYGKTFYEAMMGEVNVEETARNAVGIESRLRLATWDAITEWERYAIHLSVMKAVDAFRQEELNKNARH